LSFTFLLLVTVSISQTSQSDTTRILFIGNSYSYYNSTPQLIEQLAIERFPDKVIKTQLISAGGMTLERHWNQENARQAIRAEKWDYVVLQEQSKLGMPVIIDDRVFVGNTDRFHAYSRRFAEEIEKAGAKTVFFMTWSEKSRPEEQEILTHAYSSIAKELGAVIAPVGLVWDEVRYNDQMDLYAKDGSHPSAQGSYLVACTFFSTLFNESTTGLSGEVSGNRISSTGAPSADIQPLVNISSDDARVIQKASWKVVKAFNKSARYPVTKEPKQYYSIPVVETGKNIKPEEVNGIWYGTSTYSGDYYGTLLDIQHSEQNPTVNLSLFTPDREDQMTVNLVEFTDNQLKVTITDSLRDLHTDLTFSYIKDQLIGVSESNDNGITRYKHWTFSRNSVQNGVDLSVIDTLMQSFRDNAEKDGYVSAALAYYQQYGELIGTTYRPEESYLNAMGSILQEDNKATEALNLFELATVLYPESVNAFYSYGEALSHVGQREEAIRQYKICYDRAKKTGDKNLPIIEAKLNDWKEDGADTTLMNVLPPPPPPPPGGE
jgi:hypothetical protein